MEKNFKKYESNGITLIALVITIIVLLILAGVSIAMLTGENGILNKATTAKTKTEIAEEKEKVQLSVAGALAKDEGREIKEEYLEEELTTNIGQRGIDYELMGTGPFIVQYPTGRTYTVDTNGKISENGDFSASDIANNPDLYYGKAVINYDCTNNEAVDSWQIFYADDENIYLIASNKILYNYVPNSKNYAVGHMDDYQIHFGSVGNDYEGSKSILDTRIAKWNEYISIYPNSIKRSIRNVAYLLDTNIWNVFAGDKAEYAIGAPTIELFSASYNDISDIKLSYEVTNENGYSVKTDGDNYDMTANISDNVGMYGGYWWLASPSIDSATDILCIYGNKVSHCDFSYTPNAQPGIRPVVCLKVGTQLELVSEGFKIL